MDCAYVSARFSWVFTFESKCSWVTLVSVSQYYISRESIASAEMQTRKYFTNIVTHCFFFPPRVSFKRDECTIDRDTTEAIFMQPTGKSLRITVSAWLTLLANLKKSCAVCTVRRWDLNDLRRKRGTEEDAWGAWFAVNVSEKWAGCSNKIAHLVTKIHICRKETPHWRQDNFCLA